MASHQITKGNSAVVINDNGGTFSARLYVNVRNGLANASATTISSTFKSLAGAQRWANRKLAA